MYKLANLNRIARKAAGIGLYGLGLLSILAGKGLESLGNKIEQLEPVEELWVNSPAFRKLVYGAGALGTGGALTLYGLGRYQGAKAERRKPMYEKIFG